MTADGTIEKVRGRYTIRFERRFDHPIEEVWEAITTAERMGEWFGEGKVELDLVEGGRFFVHLTGPPELVEAVLKEVGEKGLVSEDTVLKVEPPHVFEHTWGGVPTSIVRWELEPDGAGTLLHFTAREPEDFAVEDAPRDLAGWHSIFEELERNLTGRTNEWSKRGWEGLRDQYAKKISGS